jgi:type 1 glutamine amidotransferase
MPQHAHVARHHIAFGLIALGACDLAARGQDFRALVFTKTTGYRHDCIPAGIAAVQAMGVEGNFAVEATEESSIFNAVDLGRFRVVVFLCTSGEVLDANQKGAFETWITQAAPPGVQRGWVGVHSASDTEYGWPFYGELVGAYFAGHPAIQSASLSVELPAHPSTLFLPQPPAAWVRTDEWYNFDRNPRPDVRVLLTLDESTYSGGTMGADHPIAWCHEGGAIGSGRAWYTAGGHTIESYSEPLFRRHIREGILWAAGVPACYGNCDGSSTAPVLNVLDFNCFLNRFLAGDPYANCDGSTTAPVLNVLDFNCFLNRFTAGCP